MMLMSPFSASLWTLVALLRAHEDTRDHTRCTGTPWPRDRRIQIVSGRIADRKHRQRWWGRVGPRMSLSSYMLRTVFRSDVKIAPCVRVRDDNGYGGFRFGRAGARWRCPTPPSSRESREALIRHHSSTTKQYVVHTAPGRYGSPPSRRCGFLGASAAAAQSIRGTRSAKADAHPLR